MGRFNNDPSSRQALLDALMSFGGRLSAGAATEGYGAFGPAIGEGIGQFRQSRDAEEKKRLAEEQLKRQAANDAFRQLMEQRRADQGDERLQQGEDRMSAAEKRAAAIEERQAAEDARREADRQHDNRLGDESARRSDAAARRAEATAAAGESRFERSETRHEEQDRLRGEEQKRNEAQAVASARLQAAMADYKRGDIENVPDFRDIFDEELTARGLPPVRKAAPAGATPRTSVPAGAPAPPRETPRTPGSVGASAAPPAATRAPAKAVGAPEPMPSAVGALVAGNTVAARKAQQMHDSGVPWSEIERMIREARGG